MLLNIFTQLFNEKTMPSIIGTGGTLLVFVLGLLTKDYFEKRSIVSKLQKEHEFEQRKKIKDVLAQNKVHLITACEDMNHRLWNFANKHTEDWMTVNRNYLTYRYYFHSFVYRFLAVFAWSKKIQKEMIFLDTTIASKEDLDFIKFLNVFPRLFCDLTFLEGLVADGNNSIDHFYRNNFDPLPNRISEEEAVLTFSEFHEKLSEIMPNVIELAEFFDGINPTENRKRWDRLHLFHLTLIAFLNNYGYDFQVTNEDKIIKVLTIPKTTFFWKNYFVLMDEYKLSGNKEIKRIKKLVGKL